MNFFSLFNKKTTKGYPKINILNNKPLSKEEKKQIENIVIVGIRCGDSFKNISSEISKRLSLKSVQVYKHFERIDIVI